MLIKKGDKSDAVRKIRGLLIMLGYQEVDSRYDFNSYLTEAIKRFQQEHNLTPIDGVVGDDTYKQMQVHGLDIVPFDLIPSNGTNKRVNTVLQVSNGITVYNREKEGADQIGTASTIDAVYTLGEKWLKKYPQHPSIQIGDISRKHGGYFYPHGTHRNGTDIDMRPMRKDGQMLPTNISQEIYSRDTTRELIQQMLFVEADSIIYFNDEVLIKEFLGKVKKVSGHHNHLHWKLPSSY